MRKFYNNGQEIQAGIPFEINGIAYPWNWFDLASTQDLSDRGFTVQELPDPKRTTVAPQEILELFTADDAGKIRTAIGNNNGMFLLWSALQAQKEPMRISNARFIQGWTALKQVVGDTRMQDIATQLNLDIQ